MLEQILFIVLLATAIFLISKRVGRISSNIKLGRSLARTDNTSERWKRMFLIAFGQKKMFHNPLVGVLHVIVYAGFILVNIEVLEILTDGVAGTHRVFAPFLGGFYNFLISFFELVAVSVILACIIFLVRRNILKVKRFHNTEMKAWPFLDANIILFSEIVLMISILLMNAADVAIQGKTALTGADAEISSHYYKTGSFMFSQFLVPMLSGLDVMVLVVIERGGWWFHLVGILAFSLYVTYSKHLHIFLSFPNTYFSNLNAMGRMDNMESVTKEVKLALGLMDDDGAEEEGEIRFGAKDINDLTWKNLMDAYSCTECGRCTAQCPANQTGKKLSPRKVMMDTRDRTEELGNYIAKGKSIEEALETGEILYSDRYVSKEELMACNTCNACVEACPVNIDPLSIILQMRQYVAMEEADTPAPWNAMFSNIENNMAPWQYSPSDRFNWAEKLNA